MGEDAGAGGRDESADGQMGGNAGAAGRGVGENSDDAGAGGGSGRQPTTGGSRGGGPPSLSTGGAGDQGDAAGSAGASPQCQEAERHCVDLGSPNVTICRDGVLTTETCDAGNVCAGDDAHCAPAAVGCENRAPDESFCTDKDRITCSTDRLSTKSETCDWLCQSGTCVPSTCGDGKVQTGEDCDDQNTDEADGCTSKCQWGPVKLFLGGDSSCALFGDGSAKCWGANQNGQLGLGDTENRGDQAGEMGVNLPFIQLAGATGKFSYLAVGTNFSCGVSDGSVWCWGLNRFGQLGTGSISNTPSAPVPVAVGGTVQSVAVGDDAACALLVSGDVRCWGRGDLGQLGNAGTDNVGDGPGEMGANLKSVALSGGVSHVAMNSTEVFVILTAGDQYRWGASAWDGTQTYSYSPSHFRFGDGVIGKPSLIDVSNTHSCVAGGGQMVCWGNGSFGKLDLGLVPDPIVTASFSSAPAEGISYDDRDVIGITDSNSCLMMPVSSGFQIRCWGRAATGIIAQPGAVISYGDIGDAHNEVSKLNPIDFGVGISVRAFDTGREHACAILSDGRVVCWGANENGQLGRGSSGTIGLSFDDVGDKWVATKTR